MAEPFDPMQAILARIDPALATERDRLAKSAYDLGADLQEARHQLKAAETSGTEEEELRLLTRVRRLERQFAEAELTAKQAAQRYQGAFVAAWRAVRDVEYQAYEQWLIDAEQRVRAAQQAVIDLDLALVEQRNAYQATRINPLQSIARQLQLPASEWMPDRQGKYA